MQSVVTIARQQRKHSCFLHSPWRGTALVIDPSKGIKCHRKIILKQIAFYNFEHTWWKTQKFPRNGRRIGWELGLVDLTLFKSKMAGHIIWYNNNCIISTQAFVWVIFFKKVTKAFCYPALLTVDGWFHFFSFKGLGKSEVTSILLTEARICLYSLCTYGHAPLLMGIYNNYSGYYKVRRRLYVNERFVKLTLCGRNIFKNGPDKIWRLFMLGVMLRNITWNWISIKEKLKCLVKRSLYL